MSSSGEYSANPQDEPIEGIIESCLQDTAVASATKSILEYYTDHEIDIDILDHHSLISYWQKLLCDKDDSYNKATIIIRALLWANELSKLMLNDTSKELVIFKNASSLGELGIDISSKPIEEAIGSYLSARPTLYKLITEAAVAIGGRKERIGDAQSYAAFWCMVHDMSADRAIRHTVAFSIPMYLELNS